MPEQGVVLSPARGGRFLLVSTDAATKAAASRGRTIFRSLHRLLLKPLRLGKPHSPLSRVQSRHPGRVIRGTQAQSVGMIPQTVFENRAVEDAGADGRDEDVETPCLDGGDDAIKEPDEHLPSAHFFVLPRVTHTSTERRYKK